MIIDLIMGVVALGMFCSVAVFIAIILGLFKLFGKLDWLINRTIPDHFDGEYYVYYDEDTQEWK